MSKLEECSLTVMSLIRPLKNIAVLFLKGVWWSSTVQKKKKLIPELKASMTVTTVLGQTLILNIASKKSSVYYFESVYSVILVVK